MKTQHTKGQHGIVGGNTLFSDDGRCIGIAYGWTGDVRSTQCEPNNEAKANARLWAAAPELAALLSEYIDPVLPNGFKSETEWKIDFDTRVRCALLRLVTPGMPRVQEEVARAA